MGFPYQPQRRGYPFDLPRRKLPRPRPHRLAASFGPAGGATCGFSFWADGRPQVIPLAMVLAPACAGRGERIARFKLGWILRLLHGPCLGTARAEPKSHMTATAFAASMSSHASNSQQPRGLVPNPQKRPRRSPGLETKAGESPQPGPRTFG